VEVVLLDHQLLLKLRVDYMVVVAVVEGLQQVLLAAKVSSYSHTL
jgi:hypothetical protein